MGLLLLIPGIILASTDGWFHDQHTVGTILIWAGAILLVIQLLLWLGGLLWFTKESRAIKRRF
jgi:hypothetical protein